MRNLCNLDIGTQSQDSENVQRNLEIVQIRRLRGTYTVVSHKYAPPLCNLSLNTKRRGGGGGGGGRVHRRCGQSVFAVDTLTVDSQVA